MRVVLGFLVAISAALFGLTLPAAANDQVTMGVGQSGIVYLATGGGCKPAPFWNRLQGRLPKTRVGTFSAGFRDMQHIPSCPEKVDVQEIVFASEEPGEVTFNVDGRYVRISVVSGYYNSALSLDSAPPRSTASNRSADRSSSSRRASRSSSRSDSGKRSRSSRKSSTRRSKTTKSARIKRAERKERKRREAKKRKKKKKKKKEKNR